MSTKNLCNGTAYLIEEYPEDIDCDFVFVVIKAQSKEKLAHR